jgi:acetyltransferase-like isoleucine patch superfamily enzyme
VSDATGDGDTAESADSTAADSADSSEEPVATAGGDDDSQGPDRHDRVTHHPVTEPPNSLWNWPAARHPLRVAINYAVIVIARHNPSLRLKNWLFRRLGMSVASSATWALESTPDVFWPDRITVADHAIIGYDATILCHEFLQDEYRTGEVHIGERAMVGAGAIVLPGVEIGANARVAANSLVTDDVAAETTVAGIPATPVGDEDAAASTDAE